MGVGDLPPTGVRLVAENAGGFAKDMDVAEGALKSFQNTLKTLSRISPSGAAGQPSWLDAFEKQSKVVSASMRSLTKELTSAGKAKVQLKNLIPPQMTEALQETAKTLDRFVWRLRFIPQPLREAVWGLRGFSEGMSGFVGNLRLGTVGLAAFGLAVLGLGLRGKAMTGIIEAFKVTSNMAQTTSGVLLNDLQVAAKGTIRDLDLMRVANIGLAGAGQKLAGALGKGKGLAGLLEIARAQARATGQDVNWMYESLVTGIKRSSPRLIDNTGLVLKLQEAYDAYAAKIGKAADSLSEEEKQIALLNATLKAGELAVKTYGKGTLTANEYMQRIGATVANTLDKLAVAVQPLMVAVLSVADVFVRVLAWPLQNVVAPILYELMNNAIYPLMNALKILASAFSSAFGPLGDIVHNTVVVIIAGFRTIGIILNWLLTSLAKVIGGILGLAKPMTKAIATLLDPRKLFIGAAYFIGAMADGMLWAFNNTVLPALIFIAQTIADFLCGMSPPKEGPLKDIDKGGAKVFEAWLEGFTGVSLLPIRTVLDEVNQWLGPIAKMSLDVINKKIEQLDLQIRPFQETLKIIKDEMDAILAPLNRIDEILHRKLEKGLVEFFGGRLGAEAVRAIDRQIEKFGDQKEAYESMTDQAELQLEMMTLEQVEQRSMLEIQKARLGLMEKLPKEKKPKEPKGKEEVAAGAAEEMGLPDVGGAIGEWMGYEDDVTKFMQDVSDSFMKGFKGGKQLDVAKTKVGLLKKQLDRIGTSDAFKTIRGAWDSVFDPDKENSLPWLFNKFVESVNTNKDKLEKTVENVASTISAKLQPVSDAVKKMDPTLLQGMGFALLALVAPKILLGLGVLALELAGMAAGLVASTAGSILSGLGVIKDILVTISAAAVTNGLSLISTTFGTLVSYAGPFALLTLIFIGLKKNWDGFKDSFNQFVEGIKTLDLKKTIDGLLDLFASIPMGVAEWLYEDIAGGAKGGIQKGLHSWPGIWTNFVAIVKGSFQRVFDLIFGGADRTITPLKETVQLIPASLGTWLKDMGTALFDTLLKPIGNAILSVFNALFGTPDPDSGISVNFKNTMSGIVTCIPEALSGLFTTLITSLWTPIKTVLNWIADEIAKVKGLWEAFKNAIAGPSMTEEEAGAALDLADRQAMWDAAAANMGQEEAIKKYGQRPTKGFGGNVLPNQDVIVGDKGWEIFRPQVPGVIIPHVLARGMMAPERTINQGGPVSNSWSNQRSTTINANFNLRDTAQNRRMRLAELRGWGV